MSLACHLARTRLQQTPLVLVANEPEDCRYVFVPPPYNPFDDVPLNWRFLPMLLPVAASMRVDGIMMNESESIPQGRLLHLQ